MTASRAQSCTFWSRAHVLLNPPARMVFRVSEGSVVKGTSDDKAATAEYQSLAYLQQHLPSFPAPRPHGVIQFGILTLLFTDFIPGKDLEKTWPRLDETGKRAVSRQLDALLVELRSPPFRPGVPLGGVEGGGCKDARVTARVNSELIMNVQQFEDFLFTGSRVASPMYLRFLRRLMPTSPAKASGTPTSFPLEPPRHVSR